MFKKAAAYFRNKLLVKRLFDIMFSVLGLILFFPPVILFSFLIFIEEKPPLFYIKKAVGKNGRVFKAIKFRSMDNESVHITRFGRLLRATAMDELPQLINILKGEMSFVGPRPYGIEKYGISKDFSGRKINTDELTPAAASFARRLMVTPGLTGLAQVFAPKYASDEEVLKKDLEYIEKRNFMLDLWLIFLSIQITAKKRWESTTNKI
jgi:lipopolysaccharide/colanic/teichoic acid biosynthesis glycosyltransferase